MKIASAFAICVATLTGCCGVPRNDIRELGFALAGSIAVAVALVWGR